MCVVERHSVDQKICGKFPILLYKLITLQYFLGGRVRVLTLWSLLVMSSDMFFMGLKASLTKTLPLHGWLCLKLGLPKE